MTPPRPDFDSQSHHLRAALENAQRLTEPRPDRYTESWSAQAAQVGDMTVLALAALRD